MTNNYFSIEHTQQILKIVRKLITIQCLDWEQFAFKCGYSSATIHNWKSGRRHMHTSHFHRIADALEMTPGEILRYH